MRSRLFASIFALVGCLLATDSLAYVRTRSSKGSGVPTHWPGGCAFIQPDSAGSPDLPKDEVFSIIQKTLRNWMTACVDCNYLQLMYDEPAALDAHYDGLNVVKFRTDRWCHPVDDTTPNEICYAEAATAITSVFMTNDGRPTDGVILDADIELNDVNFTFVNIGDIPAQTPRDQTEIADLENTLTHELGHLMGLSHTCRDQSSFPNDVDENGNQPPACDAIPILQGAKVRDATMYNFATPGETKKRSPEDDDVAGICNAYPIANAGGKSCAHSDPYGETHRGGGCQCNVANHQPLPPLWLALAAFLVLWRWRRRRST